MAGSWAQQRTAPAAGGRRMMAVDGKTLRGSGTAERTPRAGAGQRNPMIVLCLKTSQ